MDINAATAGGALAAQITAKTAMLNKINGMISDGTWKITDIQATGPGGTVGLLDTGTLDSTTSLQCLQFAAQTYTAQIAALNAQLAAL